MIVDQQKANAVGTALTAIMLDNLEKRMDRLEKKLGLESMGYIVPQYVIEEGRKAGMDVSDLENMTVRKSPDDTQLYYEPGDVNYPVEPEDWGESTETDTNAGVDVFDPFRSDLGSSDIIDVPESDGEDFPPDPFVEDAPELVFKSSRVADDAKSFDVRFLIPAGSEREQLQALSKQAAELIHAANEQGFLDTLAFQTTFAAMRLDFSDEFFEHIFDDTFALDVCHNKLDGATLTSSSPWDTARAILVCFFSALAQISVTKSVEVVIKLAVGKAVYDNK